MTGLDTPDNARGVVSAQKLLGQFAGSDRVQSVTVPADVTALWLYVEPAPDTPAVLVTGNATGINYPAFLIASDLGDDVQPAVIVAVSPTVDPAVTITWATSPGQAWFVVGDTGPRAVVDLIAAGSTGAPTFPAPGLAQQVAGTDGTDLRALLTDSAGRLQVAATFTDSAEGAPGSAAPAKAIQVGGTDGTDLRAMLTDTAGHQLTIDQTLKLAVAPLGAATPADAVLVGGTDGTDLRAMLTDTAGHQLTIDQTLKLIIAAINTTIPADAALVAGSDGTNLRPLLTGSTGILETHDASVVAATQIIGSTPAARAMQAGGTDGTDIRVIRTNAQGMPYSIPAAPDTAAGDHPPNELLLASIYSNADFQVLVGAPGAGKRIRVFFASLNANVPGTGTAFVFLYDTVSINHLCSVLTNAAGAYPAIFSGAPSGVALSANAGVSVTNDAASIPYGATIVYTIETI